MRASFAPLPAPAPSPLPPPRPGPRPAPVPIPLPKRSLLAFALALAFAWPIQAAAQETLPVVLNEVFYDAIGADAGFQFVELVSRTDAPVSLAGWRLEAGDGAGENRWHTIWTGSAVDVVSPLARFTVGESGVLPAPDRVLAFDLENGPDALRLVSPDGRQDLLGYGPLTYSAYFEGRPAEDVAAGFALARLPDGRDTDDNAADFRALSPATPGAPNAPEIDAALDQVVLAAERTEPGDQVVMRGRITNRGLVPLAASAVEARLWAAPLADPLGVLLGGEPPTFGDSLVARAQAAADLEPGDSVRVELSFVPPLPGALRVALTVATLDDGAPANDRVEALVQVGPGALVVSEACAAPEDGPEWIELRNVAGSAVALEAWRIEDRAGRVGHVVNAGSGGGAFAVEPESLVVLTSDPAALLARHPMLQARRVAACQPWPALNHTASGDGPAERVIVRAPDGRPSDLVDLPGGDPEGTTRERRSVAAPSRDPSNWAWSAVRGGTPGRANSIAGLLPGAGVALSVAPRFLAPRAAGTALVSWRTGFDRARVWLRLFDLRGRPIRTLVGGETSPGSAAIAFDGTDGGGRALPPGLYVLGLEAEAVQGTAHARARSWLEVR